MSPTLKACMGATVLLFMALFALAKEKAVSLSVSPRVAIAPVTLQLRLRVPPDAANRLLRVETDGGDYVRASEWPLEGDKADLTFTASWPRVPAGDYIIRAFVYGSIYQVRGMDTVEVIVK